MLNNKNDPIFKSREVLENSAVMYFQFTGTEPIFKAHFQTRPILPGIFGIELIIETASLFLDKTNGNKRIQWQLDSISNYRFRKFAEPPCELTSKATLIDKDQNGNPVISSVITQDNVTLQIGILTLKPLVYEVQ